VLSDHQPNFVLAEPVGSCTDLAATVLAPLSLYHQNLVELAFYGVMVDGPRLIDEYRRYHLDAPVTPIEVLLAHQIAEASVLLVSKADLLSQSEQLVAREKLAALNPRARIIATEIVLRLKDEPGLRVLHAKVLCVGPEASVKVSLAGGRIQADEAVSITEPLSRAAVIVNTRAATSADELAAITDSLIGRLPERPPVQVTGYILVPMRFPLS